MFFKRKAATSNDNLPPSQVQPSVIAHGMIIDGNVESQGELVIEGTVRGNIEAEFCLVEATGAVEGNIRASELVVRGRVIGPIHAGHVELHNGARVEGDVVNSSIVMEAGAELRGAVWRVEDPLAAEQPPRRQNPVSFTESSLWQTPDDHAFRPLKVIKPR